jgi:hypothetical protein
MFLEKAQRQLFTVHVMEAYRESRGIAPAIYNLVTACR